MRKWCLIVAAGLLASWGHSAPAADRPNVIVILADDLGHADIGAQSVSKDVKTPNCDSIAADGVRFTSGYVTCPVCSPSRAGLMTGTYPTRFGYELNPGGVNFPNFGMPLDQPILPELLRTAGYRTGMTGKWHLGNVKPRSPVSRGFDEFFGFWGGLHAYVNLTTPAPGMNAIRKQDEPVAEREYLTDAIGRESAAFIDRNHDKPFFLYVAFNAVHQPLQVPDKYLQRFPNEPEGKRRRMLAMLSAMDDAVGTVLAKLREHKLEERTLVFFLSDNGGPTDGNASSNAPLSGYKAQLFEGGIRIPFFARWTGKIAPGRTLDTPVNTLDIFATTMALAGAEWPKDRVHDGVDLTPWLTGTPDKPVHDRLFWRYGPQWAIREGDWKVMGLKSRAKLFNLKNDVGEKHDLATEQPDVLARIRGDYDQWAKQLVEPMWMDPNWKMDDIEFDRQESPQKAQARGGGKSVGED